MTPADTAIIFDLDDTLFAERDFLHSAYREIARRLAGSHGLDYDTLVNLMLTADNAFDSLRDYLADRGLPESIDWMLDVYRTHIPDITLDDAVKDSLLRLRAGGCRMRILTEGRPLTQGNKIEALGLNRIMTHPAVIALPKQHGGPGKSFAAAMDGICASRWVSIGDNPTKDFAEPLRMGWLTVAVADHGFNIHPQDFSTVRPDLIIDSVAELPAIIFS